jgi:copper chaperone CopZ
MLKKVYHIPDMHCSACVMRLEGLEDELEGVRSIRASYQKQTFEVEFDEALIPEEEIRKAVVELGYTIGE